MSKKVDVKLNIQENNCVDGIIILISPELHKLIKEDKAFLKQIFDNILDDVEVDNNGDIKCM